MCAPPVAAAAAAAAEKLGGACRHWCWCASNTHSGRRAQQLGSACLASRARAGGAPSSMSLCSSVNGRKRPRTSSTFFLYSVSCGICRPPGGPRHAWRQARALRQALQRGRVVRAPAAPRPGKRATRPGVQSLGAAAGALKQRTAWIGCKQSIYAL